ncbi:cation transporter [Anopheles sinensis]|uniref:Cation transporter n=1 Tax=Anopheles sinensis TaxID=74873 RepID=A0A084VHJ9_ANOSI|nr:cation transporter [Anopheles sinensis]
MDRLPTAGWNLEKVKQFHDGRVHSVRIIAEFPPNTLTFIPSDYVYASAESDETSLHVCHLMVRNLPTGSDRGQKSGTEPPSACIYGTRFGLIVANREKNTHTSKHHLYPAIRSEREVPRTHRTTDQSLVDNDRTTPQHKPSVSRCSVGSSFQFASPSIAVSVLSVPPSCVSCVYPSNPPGEKEPTVQSVAIAKYFSAEAFQLVWEEEWQHKMILAPAAPATPPSE